MEQNKILEEIGSNYKKFFNAPERHPIAMFGIECGPGWYGIILEVCKEIDEYLESRDARGTFFYFSQIKEKFGGLRIYCSYTDEKIDEIVENAAKKASITCEETGNPGKLREISGWYYCVSDEVYLELLEKFK